MGKASRAKQGRPRGQLRDLAVRCDAHEQGIGESFPGAWTALDAIWAAREDNWPAWCRVPTAVVERWLEEQVDQWTVAKVASLPLIAGLNAWRCGRQVVAVHPELWQALATTPLGGDLPAEVLLQLPAWGLYIALPAPSGGVVEAQGAYVWLDAKEDGTAHLHMIVDRVGGRTLMVPVRLASTVRGSVDAARADLEANRAALMGLPDSPEGRDAEAYLIDKVDDDELAGLVSSIVAVVLYLCSIEADVVDRSGRWTKMRRPPRPSADAPVVWEAGWRVGAALRAARSGGQAQLGGSHGRPRAHLRAAHWHHYWVGSRADRRLELRWIHPTVVAGDPDDLATTVIENRPV